MNNDDTIIAQATPPGLGSVGILRISGSKVVEIAQQILGKLPKARYADYLSFKIDNNTLDKGIALWFPSPNSFTGEDILELQGHGGPVILDLLLKHILTIPGVRLAKPGEFSERAFLNEKIDLTQAEAIFDLINASSEQSAKAAMNSLQGVFSNSINHLVKKITHLRINIETSINFPDEENNLLSHENFKIKLNDIIQDLNSILSGTKQGILIREGVKVVIAGYPNAGKSSLLNALTGRDTAIVTSIAGTTRDVLHEYIHIDGMPFHIIDTAGLRESKNEIERIGIERAWKEIKCADHLLLIIDGTTTLETNPNIVLPDIIENLPTSLPITVVRNKSDITGESVQLNERSDYTLICLSAHTGEGIDLLRKHLKKKIGFNNIIEGNFLARRRHLQSLELSHVHLQQGKIQLLKNLSEELVAEELYLAQKALGEITGTFTSDDLLDQIFSNFCIGK